MLLIRVSSLCHLLQSFCSHFAQTAGAMLFSNSYGVVRCELLSICLCVWQMEQMSGQLEALQQEHHRLTATCQDQEQQNRLLQDDCAQLQVKPVS